MTEEKRIYEILEEEHRVLTSLCEKFQASQDDGERDALLGDLRRRLFAYLQAEYMTMYAALRKHEEARELIEDCEMEQEQLRQLLEQARTAPRGELKRQRFQSFWEVLRDHIEQEEGELFPFARGYLTAAETVRLGLLFEEELEAELDA